MIKMLLQDSDVCDELIRLMYFGNILAYKALLDFFISSEAAKALEEVHLRVELIKALQYKADEKELVGYYVYELFKTKSNNTTKQMAPRYIEWVNTHCKNMRM